METHTPFDSVCTAYAHYTVTHLSEKSPCILSEKFTKRQPVSINNVWALSCEDFCKNWQDNIKIKNLY